jgi:sugar phosphate permease
VGASSSRVYLLLGSLVVGYMGVYLCRKNLSVAIPLIEADLGVSRAQVGAVAGWSTVTYAVGKFLFGPVVDRFGGRVCFLLSLLGVAVFGLAGALVSTLPLLVLAYSANRFSGSVAWGSMVKMVPGWFASRQLPLAMAWLSLSIVFGGALATILAGQIAEWSGNNWRAVMGLPALILVALLLWNGWILPREGRPVPRAAPRPANESAGFRFNQLPGLLRIRKYWVVLGLSFTLYLMREVFNNWTVDFFKTEGGLEMSSRIAAFLSTPFDVLGAVGILALGWLYGRLSKSNRSRLLFVMLLALTLLIYNLPALFHRGVWLATAAVGVIGFLSYGPYTLLAGILSVEIRGKDYVATVAGTVDGVGYLGGYLAGSHFGRIVDAGGYRWGFECLAAVTLVAAVLSLFLYAGEKEAPASTVTA